MADSGISLTEGVDKTVDTRTESTNGNHRQVIVLGDPSTNAGVAPVDAINGLSVTLTTALPAGTSAIGKLSANSGIDIGDVDITSVVPGTGATNLGKAEDSVHTTADTGVFVLGVGNVAQSTFAADGDYTPIAVDIKGNSLIAGNIAHDGVDAGNPVKVGGIAIAHGTNPTAVAAADRTNLYTNRAGIPFVIAGHPNIVTLEAAYTSAQTDTAIVTVSSGTKIVVTMVDATCSNANTVDVAVRIGFGAANTPTTTGVVLSHAAVAPGLGIVKGSGSGIVGIGADGEDLRITCGVPTGGAIRTVVTYYTIES